HIEGLVITILEVTALKRTEAALRLSEDRQRFLVRLQDALHPLSDPRAIQEAAVVLFGTQLGANRVFYVEFSGDDAVITATYVHDVAPVPGFRLGEFGIRLAEAWRRGQTIVVENVETDPRLTAAEREAYAAMDIGAFVAMVSHRGSRFAAAFGVHSREPRD